MVMMLYKSSGYFSTAFAPKELRNRAQTILKGVQFDTVVGSGISGVLPLLTIAEACQVSMMVVRKPHDLGNSHCDSLLEGTLNHKWLFVDDFVATGSTFARVWDDINKACNHHSKVHECVGAFLYESDMTGRFITFATAKKLYMRVANATEGLVAA
jgi:orotate phosphoribosyltransferase